MSNRDRMMDLAIKGPDVRACRLRDAAPEMYEMVKRLADSLASFITSEFQVGPEEPGEKDDDVVAARALLARIDGEEKP